jgi:hypothetical protein
MFRTSVFTSMFLATALGILAMGSAPTPASAFPSQGSAGRMEQPMPHFHAVNSPGRTMYRPPSKKRA